MPRLSYIKFQSAQLSCVREWWLLVNAPGGPWAEVIPEQRLLLATLVKAGQGEES